MFCCTVFSLLLQIHSTLSCAQQADLYLYGHSRGSLPCGLSQWGTQIITVGGTEEEREGGVFILLDFSLQQLLILSLWPPPLPHLPLDSIRGSCSQEWLAPGATPFLRPHFLNTVPIILVNSPFIQLPHLPHLRCAFWFLPDFVKIANFSTGFCHNRKNWVFQTNSFHDKQAGSRYDISLHH